MKTLINELVPEINYEVIRKEYSIICFKTSKTYFSFGAAILDDPNIKARSIVFEKGNSFFALFNRGEELNLRNLQFDETISFFEINPNQMKTHLLVQLFINSLNNYKNELAFNNLGGMFYTIFEISSNQKNIKVLKIKLSYDMLVEVSATNFTRIDKVVKDKPMYVFSYKNKSFKRVFEMDETLSTYTNKSFKKTEVVFLDLNKENSKVKVLFEIIKELNKRYSHCLKVHFKELEIKEKKDSMEKEFMDFTIKRFQETSSYIMNFSDTVEDEYSFDRLKNCIEKYIGCNVRKVSKLNPSGINLIYIHNAEYYEQTGITDPYKDLNLPYPIQRFTVENFKDFVNPDNEPKPALKTILKESIIKQDVFWEKKISFDNWEKYSYKNDWIFGIAKTVESNGIKNDEFYFMRIHPDGIFDCYKFENDLFNQDEYLLYRQLLVGSNTNKVLVKDDLGNINIIEQTNMVALPNIELFDTKVGRGKKDRENYYPGIVDINYYEIDNESYYNVGPLGVGMQSSIPKASHLYKINCISDSKNIVKDLLDLMGVSFVKYNSFTVLPYPIKYLREFARIE